MKFFSFSHNSGMAVFPTSLRVEIEEAIYSVSVKLRRGAATKIRDAFLTTLKSSGWSSEAAVALGSEISITSIKDGVGLCLQTGNMARMYADLIKLQTLYLDNAIIAAAIVLPSKPTAQLIGDNIAQADRLERELVIFHKAYNVPTLIFALE